MHAFKCDVTKEDQVRALFAFVTEKFGKVHICVNNAGIAHAAPLLSGDYKVTSSLMRFLQISTQDCVGF